jgi:hypothetical protein
VPVGAKGDMEDSAALEGTDRACQGISTKVILCRNSISLSFAFKISFVYAFLFTEAQGVGLPHPSYLLLVVRASRWQQQLLYNSFITTPPPYVFPF